MKRMGVILLALILGGAGGFLGARWILGPQPMDLDSAAPSGAGGPCAGGAQPLFYRNPMNPAITSPVPAKDEMGMDYIPVCPEEVAGGGVVKPGTVVIDPRVEQSIGVRTIRVQRKTLSRQIYTVGRVDVDEERLIRLHPRSEGWVEQLFVEETGVEVQQGDMLLALYSPEMVASVEEYLLALQHWDRLQSSPFRDLREGAWRLVLAARERLVQFEIPEHQIQEIEASRQAIRLLHIHTPASGVVVKIGTREGQYITPKQEIFRIADLRRVWVYADLYEHEIPWVRVGDPAELHLSALPGRVFRGRITYIYPYLDPKTRTNKVRLEFDNPDLLLKPEMFGDVVIHASRREQVLAIPREAVLITGNREHIFVRTGPGTFEPRKVVLGLRAGEWIEVLSGVKEGEEVVTSAQFLIDSESSIREAAAKFLPAPSPEEGTPMEMEMKHPDMKHPEMQHPNPSSNRMPPSQGSESMMHPGGMDHD